MELDLEIRSKKILTAYSLPTHTYDQFFLTDQGERKNAHNTDFTKNSLFDLDLWFINLAQGHLTPSDHKHCMDER